MLSRLAQMYYQSYPMHRVADDGSGWMPLLGLLVFTLLVVLIVVLIHKSQDRTTYDTRTPVEIAKERYAKGEISKDQLIEIKKELKAKD